MLTRLSSADGLRTVAPPRSNSMAENRVWGYGAIDWLIVLTTVILTRFSWMPSHLWTDTVNLAYALDEFSPLNHQPQPPGYPLFVAVARLVRFFSPSNAVAFWIISVVITAVSVYVLYALAQRMASRWVAVASAILFLVNPVVWFTRLSTPLRPALALFSLLVAYCAWRCWTGERRFAWWGAIALGIGIGCRPDLLAYLFPLWAVSTWISTRSWKVMIQGALVIAAFSAVWLAVVIYGFGGISTTFRMIDSYIREQSVKDSVLFADSMRTWLRPIGRLLLWNAMAFFGWVWALLFVWRRISLRHLPWLFFLVWALPGVVFQLFVHIGAPGHTLFATPVWCLMGACVIHAIGSRRDVVIAVAAAVSAGLFLNIVPAGYPPAAEAGTIERAFVSVKNFVAYGTFETSLERLRWSEEMTDVSMSELWQFNAPGRKNVIIALNGNQKEFNFVNWRVISYYMDRPFWVLMDDRPPGAEGRIRSVRGKQVDVMALKTVNLPRSGRVIWVLQEGGHFHRELSRFLPIHKGRYILYSDIPEDAQSFQIEGFQFVPE